VKVKGRAAAVLNEFNHCPVESAPKCHDRIPEGAKLVRAPALWKACREKGIRHSDQEDPKERKKVQNKAIRAGIAGCVKAGALAHHMLGEELVYWRPDQVR
jgi:hypothetical protein